MTRRWPIVAAAFASMFTVFGVVYSFGAFFEPMAREFGTGRGVTSGVFAVTAFIYFSFGAVSGAVADRIGPRRVLVLGAAFIGGGLLLTSRVPAIWVGYLTYGVGVGVGTACGYVPMVAAVGGWYQRGRALAIGVAVTGIGFGTIAVAPLAAVLITRVGWRQTYVLFGIASCLILLVCAVFAPRPPASGGLGLGLASAVRSREFRLLYAGGLLNSFALFVAFVHIVPFAQSRGAGPVDAAALIGVIGVGSVAGRLGLGALAERIGSVRGFQAAVGLLALSFLVWLLAPAFWALVVFALLLGFGYGGWVALSPTVTADLFGAEGLGGSVGALYTSAGIGALLGPPFAGFLVDRTGSYLLAIGCGLVLAATATALIATLPVRRRVHSIEVPID